MGFRRAREESGEEVPTLAAKASEPLANQLAIFVLLRAVGLGQNRLKAGFVAALAIKIEPAPGARADPFGTANSPAFPCGGGDQPGGKAIPLPKLVDVPDQHRKHRLVDIFAVRLRKPVLPGNRPDEPRVALNERIPSAAVAAAAGFDQVWIALVGHDSPRVTAESEPCKWMLGQGWGIERAGAVECGQGMGATWGTAGDMQRRETPD